MHYEILVEDESGKRLIDILMAKILGPNGGRHSWRTLSYKGLGAIPKGLKPKTDPEKRILLDRLPKILQGLCNAYKSTPEITAIIVICDTDDRDCRKFLDELKKVVPKKTNGVNILYRLAIEETEAWLLGDRRALTQSYPGIRADVLDNYRQDSVCGTWERLADAIHPGGSPGLTGQPYHEIGRLKSEWAETIGPRMEIGRNISPSFRKFIEGIRNLSVQAG